MKTFPRPSAAFVRLFALCLLALCVSCNANRRTASSDEYLPKVAADSVTVTTGAKRADPGYIQYLERLSMLGSQTELARVVSGSQLAWLKSAGEPFPEPLLALADTWLHINPLTMLPETKRSVFASLSSPQYWQIFGKARVGGLYISPSSGSGALWAYNRKASASGEDVIQYTFSESAGSESDYFRLLSSANTNKKLLGLELTPATTGLGPDFFLAARYHRQFSGVYCMVELPQKVWGQLPTAGDQWQGAPLSDEQVAKFASMSLLPPAMTQDFLPTGKKGGWAVTNEIYGVDGLPRRWAYRYYGSPDKPVLNWEDPSSAARRILSGSAIRSVGLLGGALVGFRLEGLYGLDSAAPGSSAAFDPFPGNEAAIAVGREVRRYGGWSWLRDDIPLSLTASLMGNGPDFLRDTVFSPGVEHAVLTGSTKLLETMVDDALMLGLDMRRFVHATTAENGVEYTLAHLAAVGSGDTSASVLPPATARKLRDTVLKEAQEKVFAAKISSPKGEDKAPFAGKQLQTTSAGVAALALGAGNAAAVTEKMLPRVQDGHYLQVLVKAMLPGVFMLSGQDLAGSLPLSWYAMTDNAAEWDGGLASRGAYALTQSVQDTAVTMQGVPRSPTIYETADAQILADTSFIGKLAGLMEIRTVNNIANARFHGRFETSERGCFAYALVLPDASQSPQQAAAKPSEWIVSHAALGLPNDGEARLKSTPQGRKLTLAERRKREHEENQMIRKKLAQKIITAPLVGSVSSSGNAALIVVANFSDKRVREVLNLYHDPVLERIRQKGGPKLLTKDKGTGGEPDIIMSNGPKTVTVTLAPWHAAVVRIGKR
ncbi:MAG: hypothetical protein DELT_02018 [Desulfovibrio sp.]